MFWSTHFLIIFRMALAIAVCGAALVACGHQEIDDVHQPVVPISQLAILGDSLASGHLVDDGPRYFDLLIDNDDARFPSFVGKDLRTLMPLVKLEQLAGPGDLGDDAVKQAFTVPPNRIGRTLVVLSIGLNDLAKAPEDLLMDVGIAAVVARRAEQIAAIVERFADTSRFPHGAMILALEPVDSTDGTNRLPDWLQDDIMCRIYEAFVATGVLARFNSGARRSLDAIGVETLELQQHFVGHGWHYDNPAVPGYNPEDPSSWLEDCWHPNARGQHEIRRLLWAALGEGR